MPEKKVVNHEKIEGTLPPKLINFLGAKNGDEVIFRPLNEPGTFKVIVRKK